MRVLVSGFERMRLAVQLMLVKWWWKRQLTRPRQVRRAGLAAESRWREL